MAAMTTRRRATLLAAAAVLALVLAACGKASGGNSALGNAPPGSPTAGATSPNTSPSPGANTTTSSGGGGSQAPLYPKDAKTYGLEILKAWGNKDYTRLGQLAEQSAVTQVKTYAAPNTQWSYISCGPDSTSYTACTYYNADGDTVVVTMNNAQLGFPTAGHAVVIDKISFSKDIGGYIGGFVGAWSSGNYARMVVYSNQTVADHFKTVAPFPIGYIQPNSTMPCPGNTSKTCARVDAQPGGSAPSQMFQVDMTKITAGKPGGITGYQAA